uniref:ATP synthase F0 subunit 8 n=1 Tax=Aneurus similis TaxID=1176472 RepID=A0A172DYR4_9HEMI|nr:ATP synthase F0 subunit 8 [Aneurus similis]AFI54672.1 ATP synthase F0 subunit 8 [Aneurus similis]
MPQMSPLWWTTLSIMFITTLTASSTMIFFNKNYKLTKTAKYSINSEPLNWKW